MVMYFDQLPSDPYIGTAAAVSLTYYVEGGQNPDGSYTPCAYDDPDPGTFSITINGVDRTSYFTAGSGGASAHAVPLDQDVSNIFQATVSNGTYTGNVSASVMVNQHPAPWTDVTVQNGTVRDIDRCALSCFDVAMKYKTPAYYSLDAPHGVVLAYRSSQAHPMAIAQLNIAQDIAPYASWFSVKLRQSNQAFVTFTNGQQEMFYQRQDGVRRVALQFDASTLATGQYSYDVLIKSHWPDSAERTTVVPVKVLVVNEQTSRVGAGWTLAAVQRWEGMTGGVLVVDGRGGVAVFTAPSCYARPIDSRQVCVYTSPTGESSQFSTFVDASNVTHYYRRYTDQTEVEFDGNGRMINSRDQFDRTTTYGYTYNATAGTQVLTSITDPMGIVTTLGYDAGARLATISNIGGKTYVTVNAAGDLTNIALNSPSRTILTAGYDSGHRMRWRQGAAGTTTGIAYDFAGMSAADTMPQVVANGAAVRPVSRVRSIPAVMLIDPALGIGLSSTNLANSVREDTLMATVTSAGGGRTRYATDRWGQPTKIVDPLQRVTTLYRDAAGLLIEADHPGGAADYAQYNGFRITYRHKAGQPISHFWYETVVNSNRPFPLFGSPDSTWTDGIPGQRVVRGQYNRVEAIRAGGVDATWYAYDVLFRVVQQNDQPFTQFPSNASPTQTYPLQKFHYDPVFGNRDSSVARGQRATKVLFDSVGRAIRTRSNGAKPHRVAFDDLNRITQAWTEGATTPDTVTTMFGVAYADSVRDAKGQVYRTLRNALGWPTQSIDALGVSSTSTFDLDGRVTSATNRRGQTIFFAYDSLGRIVKRWGDSTSVDSMKFSADGRLSVSVASGSVDSSFFNVFGRADSVVTTIHGHRYTIAATYTSTGEASGENITDASGAITFANRTFHYDSVGAMDSLGIAGQFTRFQYNELGMNRVIAFPNGNAREVYYTDAAEPYLTMVSGSASNAIASWRMYGRDSLGRITDVNRHDGSVSSYRQKRYAYDGEGHFSAVASSSSSYCATSGDFGSQCPGSIAPSLTYDATGNVTSANLGSGWKYGTIGAGNRLSTWNGTTYTYNADGDLSSKVVGSSVVATYGWTSDGKLRCATVQAGTYCYEYNGAGLPVRRTLNGLNDRWYLWDGSKLLAELDSSASRRVAEYVYLPGAVDEPHAIVTGATSIAAIRYFEQDNLGNVVEMHGPSGAIDAELEYDEWGNTTVATGGIADTNVLRWKGAVWQAPIGLYFMRARWYDPDVGRFVSEDPAGLTAGVNEYVYGETDPINGSDPTGGFHVNWRRLAYAASQSGPLAAFGSIILAAAVGPGSVSIIAALQALGAAAAFSAVAAAAETFALGRGKLTLSTFVHDFYRNFNLSSWVMAGEALAIAQWGGGLMGVKGAENGVGADHWYRAYLHPATAFGPFKGAATIGPVTMYNSYEPTDLVSGDIYEKAIPVSEHELGHVIQFFALASFGKNPWYPYAGLGIISFGQALGDLEPEITMDVEDSASFLGHLFSSF